MEDFGLGYPYNQNLTRFMALSIVCAALRVSQIIGILKQRRAKQITQQTEKGECVF